MEYRYIFTKIFSIEPIGIPASSNPLGFCPEKGGTVGIPAGIPVGYFQRSISRS